VTFVLPVLPLNKFDYKNVMLLALLKKVRKLYYISYIFYIIEEYKNSYFFNNTNKIALL